MDLNIIAVFVIIIILSTVLYFSPENFSEYIFMIGGYLFLIGILFFTLGNYIEEKTIENQVDRLVKDLTREIKIFDDAGHIKTAVSKINIPDLSEQDKDVKENNSKIYRNVLIIIFSTLIGCAIISYLSFKYFVKSNDYSQIVKHNLVMLFFIGIAYIAFYLLIVLNYRSLDSNKIKKDIIKHFREKAIC